MTGGPATPPPVNVPIRPPGTKDGTPPPPPPPTKCADCGKSFTGYAQTRWDVHLGGGVWKTGWTACFEKADAQWPDPTPKGKGATTPKKKR